MAKRTGAALAAALAGALWGMAGDGAAQERRGIVTIDIRYNAVTSRDVLDSDGTWRHETRVAQSTRMTCPVALEGASPTSVLNPDASVGAGPSASQTAAMAQLERQLAACARSPNPNACAMRLAEQAAANPALTGAAAGASGPGFHSWASEGCAGTMTADNETTLSKGAVRRVTDKVTGIRPLADADANFIAETNLASGQTSYAITPPAAAGFARSGVGPQTTTQLIASPGGPLRPGPIAGPLKSGSHRQPVPGGEIRVDWTFAPAR